MELFGGRIFTFFPILAPIIIAILFHMCLVLYFKAFPFGQEQVDNPHLGPGKIGWCQIPLVHGNVILKQVTPGEGRSAIPPVV